MKTINAKQPSLSKRQTSKKKTPIEIIRDSLIVQNILQFFEPYFKLTRQQVSRRWYEFVIPRTFVAVNCNFRTYTLVIDPYAANIIDPFTEIANEAKQLEKPPKEEPADKDDLENDPYQIESDFEIDDSYDPYNLNQVEPDSDELDLDDIDSLPPPPMMMQKAVGKFRFSS